MDISHLRDVATVGRPKRHPAGPSASAGTTPGAIVRDNTNTFV